MHQAEDEARPVTQGFKLSKPSYALKFGVYMRVKHNCLTMNFLMRFPARAGFTSDVMGRRTDQQTEGYFTLAQVTKQLESKTMYRTERVRLCTEQRAQVIFFESTQIT